VEPLRISPDRQESREFSVSCFSGIGLSGKPGEKGVFQGFLFYGDRRGCIHLSVHLSVLIFIPLQQV